jgi:hypothetical protein
MVELFTEEERLHTMWYDAMAEADLTGIRFTMYGHPLLPGWQLHVNEKEQFKEVKPDPAPPTPERLRHYARRRFIRR